MMMMMMIVIVMLMLITVVAMVMMMTVTVDETSDLWWGCCCNNEELRCVSCLSNETDEGILLYIGGAMMYTDEVPMMTNSDSFTGVTSDHAEQSCQ